jgi:hypothetical protein
MTNKKRVFFSKNGRELKSALTNCFVRHNDEITSLFDADYSNTSQTTANINNSSKIFTAVTNKIVQGRNTLSSIKLPNSPVQVWAMSSVLLFILASVMFLTTPWKIKPVQQDKYPIYASTPLTLKDMNYSIYTRDSRAQKINAVFKEYKCPLEGLGEVFVYEADKYNIPWWLVASVSFQESSCGKKTPEPSGLESYNAWGWAVYGDNVQTFDNWVRGIETVSEYMSERFYQKGITEPCDIMKTYTPPSQGSWCEGIKYFGDQIQNYTSSEKSPDTD